jgi:UDP-N-acetylmuramate: L-alanyl-gamma-D-glutamyl-meso-diaminopimelate ligase
MRVHFIGVAGTGMAALARLMVEAGHEVRGSDLAFDPPMGPELKRMGVQCMQGYRAENLAWGPEWIVVGNALRRGNVEAEAALALRDAGASAKVRVASMSESLRELFLVGRAAITVTGTHGKTTTSTMLAHTLSKGGFEPGWFIGGLPKNLPGGAAIGTKAASLIQPRLRPFVIEGDEYDSVFWHKVPKFLDYIGISENDATVLTSIELDHIDIYASDAEYEEAFMRLAKGAKGLFVYDARDEKVRRVAAHATQCERISYALTSDNTGDELAIWQASPGHIDDDGNQFFDVFVGGSSAGRFAIGVPGSHNIRNALATIAVASTRFGMTMATLRGALAEFRGVQRRQDLLGTPRGVAVYDDFAHHPTAVLETLGAFRAKHAHGRLIAVFEPRSATACRNLHQDAYAQAFDSADRVIFAPLGRSNIPDGEALDLTRLSQAINARGKSQAYVADSVDEIVETLAKEAKTGDTIALLSNGAFGGIYTKLLSALER